MFIYLISYPPHQKQAQQLNTKKNRLFSSFRQRLVNSGEQLGGIRDYFFLKPK